MAAKLSLVRDTDRAPASVTVLGQSAPVRTPAPVIDPVRDAALNASLDPDVIIAMDDAIQSALEHLHRDNGATPLAGLLMDVWRTAFATGYQAAHADQVHADLADDTLAKVVKIEKRERAELPAKERALKAVKS